jgi:deoxyhypusine synthase
VTAIRSYLETHFRHFNAGVIVDAARAWSALLDQGGRMFLSMAGAMSTAELGLSLAELIRQDKVHGLSVTGANLEEDVFNLVAHDAYVRVPNYRDLTAGDEAALLARGLNRVTDTCIPEGEAVQKLDGHLLELWRRAEARGERRFPYEYFYELLLSGRLDGEFQIDPKDSWLLAAARKNLPVFSPGWEDSTMGNLFVSHVKRGHLRGYAPIRHGLEQMDALLEWYREVERSGPVGFFQIGGGIAGDFAICAVPLLQQELGVDCRRWGYFCQISDSTTSYGSYSGAVPNEKITWQKLDVGTPKFIIESDATIVFPLVAAHVLGS